MIKLDHYMEGRVFEWVMSISMVLLAIQIYFFPRSVEFSAFQDINQVMSPRFVGVFMGTVGMIRIMSLLLNGHLIRNIRVGPFLRSLMAVFCALMWTQFALALFQLSVARAVPSPGLPFWTMFVFGELYIAYRAVRNG